jgi:hypothetical protein
MNMKNWICPLTLLALTPTAAGAAARDNPHNGQLVDVWAVHAFVPKGFDDNDEVVLVVDGYLPSGCYRLTRPEVIVDRAARTVTAVPQARYFNTPCVEVLVPYDFEVQLGVLAAGSYEVKVGRGADPLVQRRLTVAEATNAGPDDELYAPVDSAVVREGADPHELYATIDGRLPSSCMSWDDIKVVDNGDTVNVLPIVKVDPDQPCDSVETRYKKTFKLPDTIDFGRHLLHVRSLNGHAINHLFTKTQ